MNVQSSRLLAWKPHSGDRLGGALRETYCPHHGRVPPRIAELLHQLEKRTAAAD